MKCSCASLPFLATFQLLTSAPGRYPHLGLDEMRWPWTAILSHQALGSFLPKGTVLRSRGWIDGKENEKSKISSLCLCAPHRLWSRLGGSSHYCSEPVLRSRDQRPVGREGAPTTQCERGRTVLEREGLLMLVSGTVIKHPQLQIGDQ